MVLFTGLYVLVLTLRRYVSRKPGGKSYKLGTAVGPTFKLYRFDYYKHSGYIIIFVQAIAFMFGIRSRKNPMTAFNILHCETPEDIKRTKFDCAPKAVLIKIGEEFYAELYDDYKKQRGKYSNHWIDNEDRPNALGCFPCALTKTFKTMEELYQFLINGGVRRKNIFPPS